MLIRDLYAIKASLLAEASAAQVATLRAERSVPGLTQIRQSLDEDVDGHMPRTAKADAIGYARSQWSKLTAYVQHGQTRIDNNLTEQAIRPTKLTAENWLSSDIPTLVSGLRSSTPSSNAVAAITSNHWSTSTTCSVACRE